MDTAVWIGIAICLSQSAVFSGLNLALLGMSRLRLLAEAQSGNPQAERVLRIRQDSNFLLTTVLWGNVAVNCLLTLLSDSVLTGAGAFLFSTVGITILGEIVPQAYFSRNALRVGAALLPVIRAYQFLLYPIAKPTARMLDYWLGPEGIPVFREKGLREVLRLHMAAEDSDVGDIETIGALNFLALDDLPVSGEGEPIDPGSVIALPMGDELPIIPEFDRLPSDPFLQKISSSGKKWVVLTGPEGEPVLVLDSDRFLRAALFDANRVNPYAHCHRPLVVRAPDTPIGGILRMLRVEPTGAHDDVIDLDVVLVWGSERRVLTGADLLGRLLHGIASREPARSSA